MPSSLFSGAIYVPISMMARATKNVLPGRSPRMSIESSTSMNGAMV